MNIDNNITLLQPDPNSIVVNYHPNHSLGDVVSIQFDTEHGRHVVVFTPAVADYLATLFATAVKSPRIGAIADQMKSAQRDAQL
jgi:alcohol dehydrogenase class IV